MRSSAGCKDVWCNDHSTGSIFRSHLGSVTLCKGWEKGWKKRLAWCKLNPSFWNQMDHKTNLNYSMQVAGILLSMIPRRRKELTEFKSFFDIAGNVRVKPQNLKKIQIHSGKVASTFVASHCFSPSTPMFVCWGPISSGRPGGGIWQQEAGSQ